MVRAAITPAAPATAECAAAGAAALALAARHGAALPPEWDQRSAVASFLYGQDDPDAVMAAGRHGLGGQPIHVQIKRLQRCRFALSTTSGDEIVDFGEVSEIRHTLVDDPAAGVARSIEPDRGPLPQLALVILAGTPAAVCDAQGCSGQRVYALRDAGRMEEARLAATKFRLNDCPGKG